MQILVRFFKFPGYNGFTDMVHVKDSDSNNGWSSAENLELYREPELVKLMYERTFKVILPDNTEVIYGE